MDCLPKNDCCREVAVRGDTTVVRREVYSVLQCRYPDPDFRSIP